MAFLDDGEKKLVGYDGGEYSGLPTTAGGTVGGGLGVGLGVLAGPAAPIASPILGGIFGALGTALGSLFETKDPVYEEEELPPPEMFQVDQTMQSIGSGALQDPSWTQQGTSLASQYSVSNPIGFG
tara:strand:- start:15955 stop:16332 length:378 start_codon:yes stop_codon:yes gene_type:complete